MERVSKLMAQRGLCSRREAEKFMQEGRVRVDGLIVTEMGTKIPLDAKITLDDLGLTRIVVALNKPLGFVSNLPQKNHKDAKDLLLPENRYDQGPPIDPSSLHAVGRLDINSKGLLLFSSDGRFAKTIIGPDSEVEKEYVIRFAHRVPERATEKLRFGLKLDGKPLKRAEVKRPDDQTLILTLREGRNRQIRRMCELVGLEVLSLKRVRIGDIQLGDLPPGQWKIISS